MTVRELLRRYEPELKTATGDERAELLKLVRRDARTIEPDADALEAVGTVAALRRDAWSAALVALADQFATGGES